MAEALKCSNPKCGAELGRLVDVQGTSLLLMGSGLCREWHGVCAVCGKEFHWSVRDQLLESLLKRVINSTKTPENLL